MVLYETACEAEELLNMKVKSVVTDKARTKVTLSMGASARSLMIRDSVPYVQAWLNIHPLRGQAEAPLWVTRQQGFRAMGYPNLRRILMDAAKSAGITKNVSPRWLRHAGLTRMAKFLRNEQLLKKFAGWTPDSRMAAVYVHLAGTDLDEELDRLHGEIPVVEEKPLEGPLNPKACPRCHAPVAATHLFCPACGQRLALGIDEAKEIERDLWLNTYHEILMEQREKKGAMDPDFYKIMDMVEARIQAKKSPQNPGE
jgi:integrase/recombinase XerD